MAGTQRNSNTTLKRLNRERERLIEQWSRTVEMGEALSNRIQGLELAIKIIEKGENIEEEGDAAAVPASNVKALLLDFAREAKADGINANIAVKMADKRGVKLKRGTAASNLSRLKTDQALVHDGNRYRLPEHARGRLFAIGGDTDQPAPAGMESIAPGVAIWRGK